MFYRVKYNNIGIYEAIRKNVSFRIWRSLLNSKIFKWLSKPPFYLRGYSSYFTELGFWKFKKIVYPICRKYLNEDFIKIQYTDNLTNIVYQDEYQVIIDRKKMSNFNILINIILQKYQKNKTNLIYNLLNKNKNFKYHSDDYILADTKSIYNKNRTIFIDYIVPSSKLYCVINCKILQPKKNKKVQKTVITQTKDFDDNVYIHLDKDLKNIQISSFQYSKQIKIKYKNQKQFIQSFNNGLDNIVFKIAKE